MISSLPATPVILSLKTVTLERMKLLLPKPTLQSKLANKNLLKRVFPKWKDYKHEKSYLNPKSNFQGSYLREELTVKDLLVFAAKQIKHYLVVTRLSR